MTLLYLLYSRTQNDIAIKIDYKNMLILRKFIGIDVHYSHETAFNKYSEVIRREYTYMIFNRLSTLIKRKKKIGYIITNTFFSYLDY